MSWQLGLHRFIHGASTFEEPTAGPVPADGCGIGAERQARAALALLAHERQAGAATVRLVFELIWPQAAIECCAAEGCCLVGVWQGGLHHVVQVPWALVDCDRGLRLVRAVYRAGLPGTFQCAAAGLSLTL